MKIKFPFYKAKKLFLICTFVVFCSIFILFGCQKSIGGNRSFEKEGLTVTLTSFFSEQQKEGYTAYYTTSEMVVATQKELFTSFENVTRAPNLWSVKEYVEDIEVDWYAEQGINSWQIGVVEEDGLVYFTYEDDEFGEDFKVCCFGYKSADAFWKVYFSCAKTDFDSLKNDIIKYAQTVQVDAEFQETLAFEKIESKEEYRLVGLGTVCGLDIVVPAEYNGLPVTEIDGGVWGEKRNSIESVVLPDTVTKIDRGLFSSMLSLKCVQLGNAVTAIDDYAFQGCSYLEEATVPDCIESIGMEAFAYCYRLKDINLGNVKTVGMAAFFQCKALENLQIPQTMAAVGYSVFAGCEGLKTVEFPATLQTIGTAAFQGCIHLTEIAIPDSVTEIKDGAFDQCFALTKVTIPDSVTSIGGSAFTSCPVLQYAEYENCLYLGNESNPYLYLAKSVDKEIAFGKTHTATKIIASKAFEDCYNLVSMEIGSAVIEIGFNAFQGCNKLVEIYNRSTLTLTMGDRENHGGVAASAKNIYTQEGGNRISEDEKGFILYQDAENCLLLHYNGEEKDVVLPDEITEISAYAFKWKIVNSVVLGDSVTKIGTQAFFGCELSNGVTFGENLLMIEELAFAKNDFTDISFPEALQTIGNKAFEQCKLLKNVHFGSSVESIGEYAFRQCTALKKIIVPDSVTSLGVGVFEQCQSLADVTIGNSVVSEGTGWFGECENLETVVLGDKITGISDYTFYKREKLEKIVVGSSLERIGKYAFYGCVALQKAELGDCVITIDDYAFEGCSVLSDIHIPNTVRSIGNWAFYGCKSLTELVTLTDLITIGESAFSACSNLSNITFGEKLISIGAYAFVGCNGFTEITIPDSVQMLGNDAFKNCKNLATVKIGNSVKEIGWYTFESCTNLTTVLISDSIKTINSSAFNNCPNIEYNAYDNANYWGNAENPYVALVKANSTDIATVDVHRNTKVILSSAFSQCESLSEVVLPDGLIAIDESAFFNCGQLKTVNFPQSLEVIGKSAFAYCRSLTEAVLPDTVQEIGGSAFMYCDRLTTVTLPNGLQVINNFLFSNCGKLTSIMIPDSVIKIGNSAFSRTSLTEIKIPNAVTKIESSAFSWCENLQVVELGTGVKLIDSSAFARCAKLKYVIWSATKVRVGDGAFNECESFDTVYFSGNDKAEMFDMLSLSFNEALVNATVYLYSETEPAFNEDGAAYNGNYWRYEKGVPTVWNVSSKNETTV
ncbi:MAG: leucine-rich repeat domain-containing protein [Clostridia bacterium]|nr:leucine-rich repeat domain-containing protein [Clostridia bacterium]